MRVSVMTTTIREERNEDIAAIREVNLAAFDRPAEANLVDRLRARNRLQVSLVAEFNGRVIGHIAFSPIVLDPGPQNLTGSGLAPMAVLPDFQQQGVGSLLIHAGLDRCRCKGIDYVVVLGHPDYYPRFGFHPAHSFGIACSWPVPEDVFLALELRPGALAGIHGTAQYEPEFNEV
jgi:putative acetyltransferase